MIIIGSIIIGTLTAIMGYPVFKNGNINLEGCFVLFGSVLLWFIIYNLIENK